LGRVPDGEKLKDYCFRIAPSVFSFLGKYAENTILINAYAIFSSFVSRRELDNLLPRNGTELMEFIEVFDSFFDGKFSAFLAEKDALANENKALVDQLKESQVIQLKAESQVNQLKAEKEAMAIQLKATEAIAAKEAEVMAEKIKTAEAIAAKERAEKEVLVEKNKAKGI
jgi:hypothetical protein